MTDAVVSRWSVVVVVLAHDEAALLPRCLASIAVASAEVGDRALVRVFVADATGSVGRAHGAEVVEVDHRNVGAARASGASAALGASAMAPAQHTWLASTDADTVVPPDWLDHQLDLADAGFVAVAGVVRVDSFVGHPMGTESAFAARYAAEPGGGCNWSLLDPAPR